MLSSVKLFFVLSFLMPLHVQAIHQYNYKNIPLAYQGNTASSTNSFSNADVMICVPEYFHNASTKQYSGRESQYADSQYFDLSQITEIFQAFTFLEDASFLNGEKYAISHGRDAAGNDKPAGFSAGDSFNRNQSLPRYKEVLFENCYSNAMYPNLFVFSQIVSPVSPVPELPGAFLLLSGLGFMALIYRSKHDGR